MERKEHLCIAGGMQTGAATVENSMEVPQKIKNRTTLCSRISPAGYLPKANESTNLKRYTYPYAYCSIIYNGQDKEAAQMSMDK